ncbi:MAG: dihydropteroate synthase [Clostridiales bacterium]|nr:dihydropteroate synthase [Clostridiales bacterium]
MEAVWKIRDTHLPLGKRTYVMGVLNITPDSFSDGGRYLDPEKALEQALRLREAGADILDVGGQSTRPGHVPVSPEEEWSRLAPVLPRLLDEAALPLSVDTYYPDVARRCLEAGARIINDVGGQVDAEMARLVAGAGAGWVLMHSAQLDESADAPAAVRAWLEAAVGRALKLGVEAAQICLDPGIGFGKTLEQNYQLIHRTAEVKLPGYAYLLGASRKRCIGAPAGNPPFDQRDSGTAAAHTVGILGGADIIRAHDGFGAVQAARVADAIAREGL